MTPKATNSFCFFLSVAPILVATVGMMGRRSRIQEILIRSGCAAVAAGSARDDPDLDSALCAFPAQHSRHLRSMSASLVRFSWEQTDCPRTYWDCFRHDAFSS